MKIPGDLTIEPPVLSDTVTPRPTVHESASCPAGSPCRRTAHVRAPLLTAAPPEPRHHARAYLQGLAEQKTSVHHR